MSRNNTPSIIVRIIGSGFFSGYAPIAPGTAGSLLALLLYWFIPEMQLWTILLPVVIAGFLLGIPIGSAMERWKGNDPSLMVWDEVVGMWVAVLFLPHTIWLAGAAFFLFRLFDIIKPQPAKYFDGMKGGIGIMMDDVVAGLYTNLLLQLILLFLNNGRL